MKILVLGSEGQLGRCLSDQLPHHCYEVRFATKADIDVTDFQKTESSVAELQPDIIVNATAYTAVDKAEDESERANLVNNLAVGNLAVIASRLGCSLVHISTDYVFDGASDVPYLESDRTNPQNVYGVTKLLGEQAIIDAGCHYVILRTSWVYSEYRDNFIRTMLRLARQHDELSVVEDQFGCPTYAQDIAACIIKMLGSIQNQLCGSGVYHYCGDEILSWHSFAEKLFEVARTLNFQCPKALKPISSEGYPVRAKRPHYSVLNCTKIKVDHGIQASSVSEGIFRTLSKIRQSSGG